MKGLLAKERDSRRRISEEKEIWKWFSTPKKRKIIICFINLEFLTRGSTTPLVPPIKDPEAALHKKTDKKTPLQELNSAFSRRSGKKTGDSSSSLKNKSKLEHLDQIPVQTESEYDTEPKFEEHTSEPENEPRNEMADIEEMSMGAYKKQIREDVGPVIAYKSPPSWVSEEDEMTSDEEEVTSKVTKPVVKEENDAMECREETKGTKHKLDEEEVKAKKENSKKAYKRRVQAYKRRFKEQKYGVSGNNEGGKKNYGTHWGILRDDDDEEEEEEEPADQPEPQPQPRRRNMRGRGERRQPMHPPASTVGPPFGSNMAGYFDQLSLSVNWIGGTMKNIVRHLGVEQPPHLGYHYPICPRWTEYGGRGGDGAGTSGANDEEEDD
ncbi:uncharacterized protein LOC111897112 [Lactuca sativa]|uniref:uncharacterized protein LOC111897112 n=1 Tax=Lactuca sativa TaxID=4236 RepID=UPI000CD8B675|nr:uncharacterized protein LOC111897112 [Lactuca sativa]